MIKGVIFDLWLTLLNPPPDDYHALKHVRALTGLSREDYNPIHQGLMTTPLNTMPEVLEYLKHEHGMNRFTTEEVNRLQTIIDEDNDVPVFSDVIDTLVELKRKGMKIALISNAASFHKEPFYAHSLDKFFDYTTFSCDVGYWKPESEIYQLALQELGLKADEVAMVGDNLQKDTITPRSLGIHGYHLDRAGTNSYEHRVRSLAEIPRLIKG